jgi:Rieske Fe-S protein
MPTSAVKRGVDSERDFGDLDISVDSSLTRRHFCNGLLLTSGMLLIAESSSTSEANAQQSIVAYPAMKIKGAETLLPGSSMYFDYPTTSDPAVLVRARSGEFRAYSRRCSHAGCSLEVDSQSRCLRCPCHRGVFDAELGQVLFGPPQRALEQIILAVRGGGQVWAIGKEYPENWAENAKR